MIVIIWTICALAALAGYSLMLQRYYSAPTKGPRIDRSQAKGTALLVMDAQVDILGEEHAKLFPYANKEKMIAAINRLIEHAQSKGWQIIYIKQVFDTRALRLVGGRMLFPDSPGAAIDRRVRVVNRNVITKNRADAFSVPMLDDFLRKWDIGQLVICGVDGLQCVYKTAIGGVNRGFRVNIVAEAVGTLPPRTKKQLEAIYKKKGIKLVSFKSKS